MEKILVLDLDGTLLNNNYTISDNMKALISKLKNQSIYIILATGRSVSDSIDYYMNLDLHSYFINYNGGLIWNPRTDEILYEKFMDNSGETINFILKNKELFGIDNIAISSGADTYLMNKKNKYLLKFMINKSLKQIMCSESGLREVKNIHRIVLSVNPRNLEETRKELIKYCRDITIYPWTGRSDIIDLSMSFIDKWDSVKYVANRLGIKVEDIISFGDGSNDFKLLKNSGVGVAMSNAKNTEKQVANYVTKFSNNEDGVYRFILENNLL